MECIFRRPLLFLHHRPLSSPRTRWDVFSRKYTEGKSRKKLANTGSPGRMAVKPVCRVVLLLLLAYAIKTHSWSARQQQHHQQSEAGTDHRSAS